MCAGVYMSAMQEVFLRRLILKGGGAGGPSKSADTEKQPSDVAR